MILLGSGSARRRELLAGLGFSLRVEPPEVDERVRPGEAPLAYLQRVVADKSAETARKLRDTDRGCLVADTIVVCDAEILGKPVDPADARRMLERLQDRAHLVATRFSLVCGAGVHSETVQTAVHFRALSDAERDAYVASGEGVDKAGGYAIQGGAASFVREIHGSYTNVVGLPLAEVAIACAAFGLRP